MDAQQDLNDLKKQVEFERLTTAAYVYRKRGDYESAAQAINQALQINPSDLEAQEFAADILLARGKLEEAASAYKSIFEADRSRASAEEKYAKAIVLIAEGRRQQELLKEMLENPAKFRKPARSPVVAALLSIAPGFGHIYCGQLYKGIALFLGVMLSWLMFYATRPIVSGYPPEQRVFMFFKEISMVALFFALLAIGMHFYSLIDAPVTAGKQNDADNPRSSSEV